METIITRNNKSYPALLAELGDAPKQLYHKGIWNPELFEKCLAVVGTRRMTSYGKRITEQIVGQIASAGVTIVSGFMYGIDAEAHKAALKVGGKTIAVMPCGIDLVHPEHQKDLHEEILRSGGLILSEFAGSFQPTLWTYPKRNRIVAGLSQATLVVEAGEKSGSLITAHFAKKYRRKLFVVPGPLTSSVSAGILQLIREGASVATGAKDILDFYGMKQKIHPVMRRGAPLNDGADSRSTSALEGKILEQLRIEPKEVDELARQLRLPVAKLGTALSMMQLSGAISEEKGKYYITC